MSGFCWEIGVTSEKTREKNKRFDCCFVVWCKRAFRTKNTRIRALECPFPLKT